MFFMFCILTCIYNQYSYIYIYILYYVYYGFRDCRQDKDEDSDNMLRGALCVQRDDSMLNSQKKGLSSMSLCACG